MIINHNMSAEYANRLLRVKGGDVDKNIEKLSSGMRINRAGDDASGLAVSEKMATQVRGLNQASRNAQDGISFIQTTEGYLANSQTALQRIRELAIQGANGIYSAEDRNQIQVEVSQLVDEIDRIASHAQFNGMNMLTGRFSTGGTGPASASLWLHIGANMDQRVRLYIGTMTSQAMGVRSAGGVENEGGMTNGKVSVLDPNAANMTIGRVDSALLTVMKQRADLGAYQNRLELMVKGIEVGSENLLSAQARIQDTDMAREMSEFSKNQILVQSSTAMVAQANQKNQGVLRLLG